MNKHLSIAFVASLTALSSFSIQAEALPTEADKTVPIKVGAEAPNPSLRLPDGTETSLSKLRGESPTVVIFYRGGWCPYCQRHLQSLMDIEKNLTDAGWKLLALSPDRPEELLEATKDSEFSYQLVSDQDMNAAKAFGLAFRVSDELVEKYKGYGIDLQKASSRNHQLLPVPAVLLIDAEGKLTYVHTNPDYKKRLSNEALLKAAGVTKP